MQVAKLLSNSPLVTNCAHSCSFLNIKSIYGQSLRWKRKPIWLPTAKTKVFRVPKRPDIPADEQKEILRLYNNYRTYYRAVRAYFKAVIEAKEVQLDQSVLDKEEEEDYNKCMIINDQWNAKIAELRKQRLINMQEDRIARAQESLKKKQAYEAEKYLLREENVRTLKAAAVTFITKENIDEAIEKALENVVDYNKALTINGEWYTDKTGLPPVKEPEKIQLKQYTFI